MINLIKTIARLIASIFIFIFQKIGKVFNNIGSISTLFKHLNNFDEVAKKILEQFNNKGGSV